MHLKVFTKCQMLCNAYDDMSGFSILNTRGVTSPLLALLNCAYPAPAAGVETHRERSLQRPAAEEHLPFGL